MKTIKEFKNHFIEDNEYCQALKDVLKLIDELMLKYGSTALDELKSKIEG